LNLPFQIIIALFFGLLCWGIGGLILSKKISSEINLLCRQVIFFTFGNIVFSYMITALGALGMLKFRNFLFILAGAAIATCFYLIRSAKARKESLHIETTDIIFFVVAIVFSFPGIIIAFAPPFMRDTLVYHLAAPKYYLSISRLSSVDGNFFYAFPKGYEMILALLLSVAGDRAAQFFSVLQHLAAVIGIYALIYPQYGKPSAWICSLGFATIPTAIYFCGCGYVEPAIILILISSLILLENCQTERKISAYFILGIMAGWLISLKYTGILYVGLIALMALIAQKNSPLIKAGKNLASYSLGILPGMFWLAYNRHHLGNPVYPFAYDIFNGKGWDLQRALSYKIYLQNYGMGRNLLDYILLPFRFFFLGKFNSMQFDGYLGPLAMLFFVGAITALILSMRRKNPNGFIPGLGYSVLLSGAFFIFGTQQARFYLPTHLLICIYIAPLSAMLLSRIRRSITLKFFCSLLFFILIAMNAKVLLNETIKLGCYKPLVELESEDQFRTRKIPGFSAIRFLNKNTSASSKTLCAWTGNYGYYFDRKFIADSFVEDYTLKQLLDSSQNQEVFANQLQSLGITHLFFSWPMIEKSLDKDQSQKLKTYVNKYSTVVFHQSGFIVFELKKRLFNE